MYYYIFEQAQSASAKRLVKKIKELCNDTGISGETVSPSPARSVEELALMSSSKGYSTVVAVGKDGFINKVASSLLEQNQDKDRKIVLGVIPFDYRESFIAKLIGINNLNEAVETLKFRKLSVINPGFVEPNKFFISPLVLEPEKRTKFTISTSDFQTEINATKLEISQDMQLSAVDDTFLGSPISQIFSWLIGKTKINQSLSKLRHKSFKVMADDPVAVTVEQEIVAKTPIIVRQSGEQLHLIVSRDKIASA